MTLGGGRIESSRLALVVAIGVLAALVGSCGGPSTEEAFCDRVAEVKEAGPLFPARTDGEPVPDLAVLAAIETLADNPPDAVAEQVGVLVDEARVLSADAVERLGLSAQVEPPEGRWSRSVVESAQSAVTGYAQEECGIELTPQRTE